MKLLDIMTSWPYLLPIHTLGMFIYKKRAEDRSREV